MPNVTPPLGVIRHCRTQKSPEVNNDGALWLYRTVSDTWLAEAVASKPTENRQSQTNNHKKHQVFVPKKQQKKTAKSLTPASFHNPDKLLLLGALIRADGGTVCRNLRIANFKTGGAGVSLFAKLGRVNFSPSPVFFRL